MPEDISVTMDSISSEPNKNFQEWSLKVGFTIENIIIPVSYLNINIILQTAPLMTVWSKDISPDTCHREYPRPQENLSSV